MYYLLPIILVVIWATALIGLCSRRDIDVHTKISWLVVVIVLQFIGAIIYFLFGPKSEPERIELPEVPEDSEPIHPDNMKSWNPITGYNPNESGEGLNPSSMDKE